MCLFAGSVGKNSLSMLAANTVKLVSMSLQMNVCCDTTFKY